MGRSGCGGGELGGVRACVTQGSSLHKDLKEAKREPHGPYGHECSRQKSLMCKGPGVGACLECSEIVKEAGMAAAGLSQGVVAADELI